MENLERLTQRHNVRLFDDTYIPDREEIFNIFSLLDHIPNQKFDLYLDHINLVLEPEHYDFKYWLCKNIFYNVVDQEHIEAKITKDQLGSKQYMVQVLSAPYVILAIDIGTNINDSLPKNTSRTARNMGVEIGFLMDKYLSLGLNLANVGCTVGFNTNTLEKQNQLVSYLYDLFDCSDMLSSYDNNALCVSHALCIGKEIPNLNINELTNPSECNRYYKDLPYFACNKSKKPSNLIYKK